MVILIDVVVFNRDWLVLSRTLHAIVSVLRLLYFTVFNVGLLRIVSLSVLL